MNIIARRGATKKDLLRRGQYESIPSVILADTGLTATAKLVYIALVSHLFHGKRAVWPSVERLAAMVGFRVGSNPPHKMHPTGQDVSNMAVRMR